MHINYHFQSEKITNYPASIIKMEQYVQDIINKKSHNLLWFLEYNHLYTAGSSAIYQDLLSNKISLYQTNRGGKHTYHGPGQQICYLILDLNELFNSKPDIRQYIRMLEQININLLKKFDIDGQFSDKNIGVWVRNKKIMALGIKVKKWIAYHGFALNVNTDLSYYNGIVSCGMKNAQITSIQQIMQKAIDMKYIRYLLINEIKKTFQFLTINEIQI